MANINTAIEGAFGLSADVAIVFSVVTGVVAMASAVSGVVLVRTGGSMNGRLMMLLMTVVNVIFSCVAYTRYQELLAQSNYIKTGPIYFWFFAFLIASLPLGFAISLFIPSCGSSCRKADLP